MPNKRWLGGPLINFEQRGSQAPSTSMARAPCGCPFQGRGLQRDHRGAGQGVSHVFPELGGCESGKGRPQVAQGSGYILEPRSLCQVLTAPPPAGSQPKPAGCGIYHGS